MLQSSVRTAVICSLISSVLTSRVVKPRQLFIVEFPVVTVERRFNVRLRIVPVLAVKHRKTAPLAVGQCLAEVSNGAACISQKQLCSDRFV